MATSPTRRPSARCGRAWQPDIPPAPIGQRPAAARPAKPCLLSPVRTLFVQNRDAAAIAAAAAPAVSHAIVGQQCREPLFAGGLAAWRSRQRRGGARASSRPPTGPHPPPPCARPAPTGPPAPPSARPTAAPRSCGCAAPRRRPTRSTAASQDALLGPSLACLPGETLGTADIDALARHAGRQPCLRLAPGRREAPRRGGTARAMGRCRTERHLRPPARLAGTRRRPDPVRRGIADRQRCPHPEPAQPPALHPAGGFVIDPSLIYALVHHESNFSPGRRVAFRRHAG